MITCIEELVSGCMCVSLTVNKQKDYNLKGGVRYWHCAMSTERTGTSVCDSEEKFWSSHGIVFVCRCSVQGHHRHHTVSARPLWIHSTWKWKLVNLFMAEISQFNLHLNAIVSLFQWLCFVGAAGKERSSPNAHQFSVTFVFIIRIKLLLQWPMYIRLSVNAFIFYFFCSVAIAITAFFLSLCKNSNQRHWHPHQSIDI